MDASVQLRRCGVVALVTAAIVTLGCSATAPPRVRRAVSVDDEIPRVQIDSTRGRVQTAYELIRLLRPSMLVSREPRAAPSRSATAIRGDALDVTVYVDEQYVGHLEILSSIPARTIVSIRRMSLATAPARYGQGLAAGVIVITTSASPDARR